MISLVVMVTGAGALLAAATALAAAVRLVFGIVELVVDLIAGPGPTLPRARARWRRP